jgi:hypothetical protein
MKLRTRVLTAVAALSLSLGAVVVPATPAGALTCTAPYSMLITAWDGSQHCINPTTHYDANGYYWTYGPTPPYGFKWR